MSATLLTRLGLDTKSFKRGLDSAMSSVSSAQSKFASIFSGAMLGVGVSEFLDKFGRVADLASRFGETAVTIQRVSGAAEQAGSDIETVAKAMSSLSVQANKAATEGGKNAEAFKSLGINAAAFRDAAMEDQLAMLADAYTQATGDGQKHAQFMELLGGRHQNLIPLLNQGGEALRQAFADAPVVSDTFVDSIDRIGDAFQQLKGYAAVALETISKGFGFVYARAALVSDLLSGKGLKESLEIYKQTTQEIVNPTPDKKPKSKSMGGIDPDEAKETAKLADDIAKAQKRVGELERKMRLEAMEDEERLHELYRERDELLQKANDTTVEGLEAKSQALQLEMEAMKLSEKVFEEAEERGRKNFQSKEKREAESAKRRRAELEAVAEELDKERSHLEELVALDQQLADQERAAFMDKASNEEKLARIRKEAAVEEARMNAAKDTKTAMQHKVRLGQLKAEEKKVQDAATADFVQQKLKSGQQLANEKRQQTREKSLAARKAREDELKARGGLSKQDFEAKVRRGEIVLPKVDIKAEDEKNQFKKALLSTETVLGLIKDELQKKFANQ